MHIDYWESLTNRIHGSFSSRSTMRVLVDPQLCSTRVRRRQCRRHRPEEREDFATREPERAWI